jgi:hypothetical protein
LVVCASIASCDDFDDIAEWGKSHLSFLRRFLPYHHGIPGARWLSSRPKATGTALILPFLRRSEGAHFLHWLGRVTR